MNPYLILGGVVFWGATVAGGIFWGIGIGRDGEIANQAKIDKAITDTREAAQQGAANAIAQIKVRNTTVQGKVETIVREDIRYRDCRHDDIGVLVINEALTGKSIPLGDSKLPRTNPTDQF